MAQLIALSIAFLCLFLSGFISGSEIAYFSLSAAQREELIGRRDGRSFKRLFSRPEQFLATVLIANNLVNVSIVVLINFSLGPVFSGMNAVLSFILQTVLLTLLILLFGEILPKLIANSRPMSWIVFAAPILHIFIAICSPVSRVMVKSTSIVRRMVTKRAHNISTDELSSALEITDVKGKDDKEMLEGILKFGDTTASEIMTPRIDITDVDITWPFDRVMQLIIESGYSRLPVYEGTQDNIRGVLYARDMLPYVDGHDPEFRWQTLLREPYFVPESRMIDDLLEDFRRRRLHLAIVVDEFGGTQGIVTLEDILEEIVGDINDEYDEVEETFKRLKDNTFIFEGRTLLTDFFRITEQDPEEYEPVAADVETLAGMLLAIKGDFVKEKEPLVYGHCRFLILEVEGHRITEVRVKVMPDVQVS